MDTLYFQNTDNFKINGYKHNGLQTNAKIEPQVMIKFNLHKITKGINATTGRHNLISTADGAKDK